MIYVLLGTVFGCALSSSATSTTSIISNAGGNITLPCLSTQSKHRHSQHKEVYWQWSGRLVGTQSPIVTKDGSLHLPLVTVNSSGNYSCFHEADDVLIVRYSLLVPGPPPPPANLSASEMDDMIILRWHNTLSPAYLAAAPDTVLRLRYRPLVPQLLLPLPGHAAPHLLQDYNSGPRIWPPMPAPDADVPTAARKWRVLPRALPPNQPLVALQQPSEESCQFEVWAENSYGSSPHVAVTTISRHPASQTFTKSGAWDRSRFWLAAVITVLVSCNATALVWICYHSSRVKRNRRRQRALTNHSGLSGECEQLELVCHAHDPHSEAVSLTLPHHAALV
ncbi:Immunoglobulin-like domain [Trinorchestia longiramus]|nr:Immunoglobulin-like domain [Trinorchestia longiramus]